MNTTTRPVLKNGRYVLKNRLRKGIFSVTYRATDSQSNQTVAIKTLNDRLPQQRNLSRFKQQFLLTAEKLAAIEHPHLARVLDYFEEEERPYLVMEYLPGQTLEELVPTPQPLAVPIAIHYIRQIGQALSVLHQQGLLHRDIRPQNIIQPLGKNILVLTEFDLGGSLIQEIGQAQANLLSTGYAPPEKYSLSAQLTPAADIYSLAATLYFLLVGQPPVPAPVRESYWQNYLRGNSGRIGDRLLTPTLRQAQPRLSSAVELAIVRGLQISPLERPQTVKAWLAILPRTLTPAAANSSERRVIAGFDFGRRFTGQRIQQIREAIEQSANSVDESTSDAVVPIDRDLGAKEPTAVPDLAPTVDPLLPPPELKSTETSPQPTDDLASPRDGDLSLTEPPLTLANRANNNSIAPVEPAPNATKPSLRLETRSGKILVTLNARKDLTLQSGSRLEQFSGETGPNSANLDPQALETNERSALADGSIGSIEPSKLEQAEENNYILPTLPLESVEKQKPSQKSSDPPKKKLLLRSLILTWAAAASAGIGFGLALRFNRPIVAGSTILHTDQSFPPRDLWPVREGEEPKDKPVKPIRSSQ